MKVLVTGGAGFIGSHIVEFLLENNIDTVVVDNLVTGHKYNIPSKVAFYHFDIRDPNIDKIFMVEKPDFVIHQAAQVSVQESVKQPFYDCSENVMATVNILQACIKYNVKKIIYASTAAVYGNPQYLPIDENHDLNPVSFYGLSKLTSEAYIQLFAKLYGLKYTILRYSNVYGARQNPDGEAGVISIFMDRLFKNDNPIIYGDGNQTRDFIFVKDVAHANFLAFRNADNQICNISSNQQISVNELLDTICNLMKIEDKRIYKEERPGDVIHSYLSNDKARKYLNWHPKFSLLQGLRETISFFHKE
ncbi:UDP-glucose 4-epimerase [Bacillus pseudomycoides]|uniref:NAD-dependent epimerase/dehydratase family protein n=1 Tax=Bacillus pseudomycoides TaxID=64104 RepID=UPI000BF526ED|nr:NAD-dependent epimerase/dehydratase family protein [Bacillus pseudomycoides]MBD5796829.1 UDP-glucose 4-epimerase [Bacillus pseudomycoides]MED1476027.1 NAD-dependent epimerase/dehydratase family protein [Bacillus pseudomycoides]PEO91227.1 UDP-glucose 4-epimerase [Bacillus pseudomycoides]PFW97068.1 UDP-glucose 4-epimerase [Bacillus pseudomycoides]PFX38893.1 UDP-glucose 4-epimerase [Bacillus pseudomycoides]